MNFKQFIEALQDFNWFQMGQTSKVKLNNSGTNPAILQPAKQRAQTFLAKNDPTLDQNLKQNYKAILINWIAHQMIEKGYKGETSDQKMRIGFSMQPYNPNYFEININDWETISITLHAHITEPEFWNSLNKYGNNKASVSINDLKNDAHFLRQNKKNNQDNPAPEGRTLINFPDGHKWLSLDKAYCEKEGKAGNHCGNINGQTNPSQIILSLRSPENTIIGTFVVDHGQLIEAKGYGNTKINPQYYPYIAKLFLTNSPPPLPITKTISGNNHLPESDTNVLDLCADPALPQETKEQLTQKFHNEINDPETIENYLSQRMSDKHRMNIISLLYKDKGPEFIENKFKTTKYNDKFLESLIKTKREYLGDIEKEIKNYRQQNIAPVTQTIDNNIKLANDLIENLQTILEFIKTNDPTKTNNKQYDFQETITNFAADWAWIANYPDYKQYAHTDHPNRRTINKLLKKYVEKLKTLFSLIQQHNTPETKNANNIIRLTLAKYPINHSDM